MKWSLFEMLLPAEALEAFRREKLRGKKKRQEKLGED